VAIVAAGAAWIVWYEAGLVLSHYDAKAHLVVARRVFDSLTPGWQQLGAVWLPLPHLINLLPTQIDLLYRTGAFASAVSIACFGITAWAAARLILLTTGSLTGAVTCTLLLALNPNLLYLHATPMTEPLLIAATFVAVLWMYEWLQTGSPIVPRRLDGILFAAAWTRYEAWLVLAVLYVSTAFVLWRTNPSKADVVRRVVRLTAAPAIAVTLFLLNSRITVGAWFVSAGFYVPDPTYEGLLVKSLIGVWWGTHQLSGYAIETIALLAAAVVAVRGWRRPSPVFVTLSLFAAAALPFYAFVEGHPYRIRYMIPLVAASALFGGLAVGGVAQRWSRRAGEACAAALVASTLLESSPWSGNLAPLIEESTWDYPASLERRAVTACLRAYRGEKIVASMGSLAHYMQELSADGLGIADFIHEGNGTVWRVTMDTGAAAHAGWMLVDEESEGGDVLAQRLRHDPSFARGMSRVCEGGGVALYRRD
jgi:hypothetical protein